MNRRNVYTGGLAVAALVAGAFWLFQDDADARALPVKPAHAHAVEKPDPLNDCGGAYRLTVQIPTTETALDGAHHAALWVQQDYGDPRWVDSTGKRVPRSEPGRWEAKRACLAGTGVSTGRVVKVVAYVDPCRIDGTGGPVYGIGNDLVDDDKSPDGRVKHVKVRIHFPAKVLAGCVR